MTPPSATLHRDALAAGTVLNGYRILGVLGRGGFGITYRASDLLDQSFAIKEYFPRQFAMRADRDVVVASESDEEVFVDCRKRFLTEARLLAALGRNGGTAGVVQVVTFFEANNTAYSVMEFLTGETLQDLLSANASLSPQLLFSLLRGILAPLARVHAAGFLHRDLKPSNILISSRRPAGLDRLRLGSGYASDLEHHLHTGLLGSLCPDLADDLRSVPRALFRYLLHRWNCLSGHRREPHRCTGAPAGDTEPRLRPARAGRRGRAWPIPRVAAACRRQGPCHRSGRPASTRRGDAGASGRCVRWRAHGYATSNHPRAGCALIAATRSRAVAVLGRRVGHGPWRSRDYPALADCCRCGSTATPSDRRPARTNGRAFNRSRGRHACSSQPPLLFCSC